MQKNYDLADKAFVQRVRKEQLVQLNTFNSPHTHEIQSQSISLSNLFNNRNKKLAQSIKDKHFNFNNGYIS